MFSDTHFHFSMIKNCLQNSAVNIVKQMVNQNCFFALDIGTKSEDVFSRANEITKTISELSENERTFAEKFFFQSAGIWPAKDAIQNRKTEIEKLKKAIVQFENQKSNDKIASENFSFEKKLLDKNPNEKKSFNTNSFPKKICAIGECGCDHHWNPNGADGRNEEDFPPEILFGENELFEMQLSLAKKMQLPIIVHSRDAFFDTLSCIKNAGYDNGIIHCFSYGIDEAKKFLERGWFLSFSGSVTYTKKSRLDDMKKLLCLVPSEQLLCETDAPYLSPVPHRGEVNTPANVSFVYEFVAKMRGVSVETLSKTVDENCKRLFHL